jgi:transcriptional regulator with GAF, ATPase, and Fis domain
MQRFQDLMLDLWREACRHIEIEHSTATIAQLLTHRMPIDRLAVLAFDCDASAITIRATALSPEPLFLPITRTLQPAQKKRLLTWARTREPLRHHNDDAPSLAALLLPDHPQGDWLLGPLFDDQRPTGALLLRIPPPKRFTATHLRMFHALLEPFSAALENDRHLHELKALRDAAEADKRSALSRLGRAELTDTIIGANAGLRPVMDRVALVSRSDIPVLILGETGSGKEVIARSIHDHSARAKGPFIRVNCGAIPPELIDSELFGHEKGAFTGATASRRGWFERADGGTLLLDEIGELPLPAQVRLLRVLQEGIFERVGGEHSVKVDLRIVAATHRDLPAMVQQARFREDLWYRISGFPIVLPPLRERKQDIPTLAAHFAQRAATRFGLRLQQPSTTDLTLLASYDWPGNIRELASVIDRAAILGDGESLHIARALGAAPWTSSPRPSTLQSDNPQPNPAAIASLDDATRRHIEAALTATHGRIEGPHGVAALLHVNPHTLRARMRKLGIAWRNFR